MDIQPLSTEHAHSLDVSAIQRLLGELDSALYEVGKELQEKMIDYNRASGEVNVLKIKKEILIERARNLKSILKGA